MGPLLALGGPCTSVCALMLPWPQPLGSNPFTLTRPLAESHFLPWHLSPPPGRDPSDLSLPSGCKAKILTASHIPGLPDRDQHQSCSIWGWDDEGSEGLGGWGRLAQGW